MPFETSAQIRFAHVDAAGIVFYPRYFEMLNAAVEDWCARALGVDFRTMHLKRGFGVPTVKLEVDFLSPSELGDDLIIQIFASEIGRSSCRLDVVFKGEGRDRLRVRAVLVCMDLTSRESIPWPDDMRARMIEETVPAV